MTVILGFLSRISPDRDNNPFLHFSLMLNSDIKQVIVVRVDLNMSVGKSIAQAAHASLDSYLQAKKSNPRIAKKWIDGDGKKIVLKVDDEETLVALYKNFRKNRIPAALIVDSGLTELPNSTKTALGIGPWMSLKIDKFTKGLKLL